MGIGKKTSRSTGSPRPVPHTLSLVLFQTFQSFVDPVLTAYENVEYPLAPAARASSGAAQHGC